MTVCTTTNKVSYIGNGIATEFAIPFPFLEKKHLKVYQLLNNIKTERGDWTVQNGNLIFETPPQEEAQIMIMRIVPFIQDTDYCENEILAAETLERNFDQLTMQIQQLKEQVERTVMVDIFDDTNAESLIPNIRQAVSDCTNILQQSQAIKEQTNNLLTDVIQYTQSAETSAENAATSETNTATMLSAKANVGLNNLTQNGRDMIVTSLIPDYARGITVTSTALSYKAPANGRLYFNVYGGMGGRIYNIFIDDVRVFDSQIVSAGEYRNQFFYDIKKNSVVTWAVSSAVACEIKFFPF